MTEPQPPRTLTAIKQYRLVREIGRGGMGTVYEAVDNRDGSRVAVKLLHPWLVAEDPAFRDRFEREAHIAALLRSPYTVRLADFGVAEGFYYLVMEFVEGTSLADELEAGPMDPVRALRIGVDVARALEEAFARGVVHRDIKPGNILLTADGRVKVTDFGIARHTGGSGMTVTGSFVGTADYAPPEQAGGETDTRSDIYSLGATLYCMLAGHPPFQAATVWEILAMHQTAEPPVEPLAHLPAAIVNPIRRCLEKDPRDRYQTPSELAGALERALSSYSRQHQVVPPGGHTAAARPVTAPTQPFPATPPAVAPDAGPTRVAGAPGAVPPPDTGATRVAGPPSGEIGTTRVAGPPPYQPPVPAAPPAPYPPGYGVPFAVPPQPQPAARRGGVPSWVFVAAAVVVVAIIAAIAFFALSGGDDDTTKTSGGGGSTPPAGASATLPPLRATTAATATAAGPTATPPPPTATPTPAPPTATPTRVLPTPVLAGFPSIPLPNTSPEREIVDAVNRNGPAYAAALTRRDESLLSTVFTGEALDQYAKDVRDERAKPQPTQNTLLSIDLVTLQPAGTTATVTTKERWRVQQSGTCTEYSYDETYNLVLADGLWKVARNPFVRTSMRAC